MPLPPRSKIDPYYKAPEEVSQLGSATDAMQSNMYRGAEAFARIIKDKQLEQAFRKRADDNLRESQKYTPYGAQRIEDVTDVNSGITYLQNLAANQIPQYGTMLGTGLAATALTGGNAAAGVFAAALSTAPQHAGEIYNQQLENEQWDPNKVLAGTAANTGMDLIPGGAMAKIMGLGAKGSIGKAVLRGGLSEAPIEGTQKVVTDLSSGVDPNMSKEYLLDVANEVAAGGIMGGAIGGAGHIAGRVGDARNAMYDMVDRTSNAVEDGADGITNTIKSGFGYDDNYQEGVTPNYDVMDEPRTGPVSGSSNIESEEAIKNQLANNGWIYKNQDEWLNNTKTPEEREAILNVGEGRDNTEIQGGNPTAENPIDQIALDYLRATGVNKNTMKHNIDKMLESVYPNVPMYQKEEYFYKKLEEFEIGLATDEANAGVGVPDRVQIPETTDNNHYADVLAEELFNDGVSPEEARYWISQDADLSDKQRRRVVKRIQVMRDNQERVDNPIPPKQEIPEDSNAPVSPWTATEPLSRLNEIADLIVAGDSTPELDAEVEALPDADFNYIRRMVNEKLYNVNDLQVDMYNRENPERPINPGEPRLPEGRLGSNPKQPPLGDEINPEPDTSQDITLPISVDKTKLNVIAESIADGSITDAEMEAAELLDDASQQYIEKVVRGVLRDKQKINDFKEGSKGKLLERIRTEKDGLGTLAQKIVNNTTTPADLKKYKNLGDKAKDLVSEYVGLIREETALNELDAKRPTDALLENNNTGKVEVRDFNDEGEQIYSNLEEGEKPLSTKAPARDNMLDEVATYGGHIRNEADIKNAANAVIEGKDIDLKYELTDYEYAYLERLVDAKIENKLAYDEGIRQGMEPEELDSLLHLSEAQEVKARHPVSEEVGNNFGQDENLTPSNVTVDNEAEFKDKVDEETGNTETAEATITDDVKYKTKYLRTGARKDTGEKWDDSDYLLNLGAAAKYRKKNHKKDYEATESYLNRLTEGSNKRMFDRLPLLEAIKLEEENKNRNLKKTKKDGNEASKSTVVKYIDKNTGQPVSIENYQRQKGKLPSNIQKVTEEVSDTLVTPEERLRKRIIDTATDLIDTRTGKGTNPLKDDNGNLIKDENGVQQYGNTKLYDSLRAMYDEFDQTDPNADLEPLERMLGLYEAISMTPKGDALVAGVYEFDIFDKDKIERKYVEDADFKLNTADIDKGFIPLKNKNTKSSKRGLQLDVIKAVKLRLKDIEEDTKGSKRQLQTEAVSSVLAEYIELIDIDQLQNDKTFVALTKDAKTTKEKLEKLFNIVGVEENWVKSQKNPDKKYLERKTGGTVLASSDEQAEIAELGNLDVKIQTLNNRIGDLQSKMTIGKDRAVYFREWDWIETFDWELRDKKDPSRGYYKEYYFGYDKGLKRMYTEDQWRDDAFMAKVIKSYQNSNDTMMVAKFDLEKTAWEEWSKKGVTEAREANDKAIEELKLRRRWLITEKEDTVDAKTEIQRDRKRKEIEKRNLPMYEPGYDPRDEAIYNVEKGIWEFSTADTIPDGVVYNADKDTWFEKGTKKEIEIPFDDTGIYKIQQVSFGTSGVTQEKRIKVGDKLDNIPDGSTYIKASNKFVDPEGNDLTLPLQTTTTKIYEYPTNGVTYNAETKKWVKARGVVEHLFLETPKHKIPNGTWYDADSNQFFDENNRKVDLKLQELSQFFVNNNEIDLTSSEFEDNGADSEQTDVANAQDRLTTFEESYAMGKGSRKTKNLTRYARLKNKAKKANKDLRTKAVVSENAMKMLDVTTRKLYVNALERFIAKKYPEVTSKKKLLELRKDKKNIKEFQNKNKAAIANIVKAKEEAAIQAAEDQVAYIDAVKKDIRADAWYQKELGSSNPAFSREESDQIKDRRGEFEEVGTELVLASNKSMRFTKLTDKEVSRIRKLYETMNNAYIDAVNIANELRTSAMDAGVPDGKYRSGMLSDSEAKFQEAQSIQPYLTAMRIAIGTNNVDLKDIKYRMDLGKLTKAEEAAKESSVTQEEFDSELKHKEGVAKIKARRGSINVEKEAEKVYEGLGVWNRRYQDSEYVQGSNHAAKLDADAKQWGVDITDVIPEDKIRAFNAAVNVGIAILIEAKALLAQRKSEGKGRHTLSGVTWQVGEQDKYKYATVEDWADQNIKNESVRIEELPTTKSTKEEQDIERRQIIKKNKAKPKSKAKPKYKLNKDLKFGTLEDQENSENKLISLQEKIQAAKSKYEKDLTKGAKEYLDYLLKQEADLKHKISNIAKPKHVNNFSMAYPVNRFKPTRPDVPKVKYIKELMPTGHRTATTRDASKQLNLGDTFTVSGIDGVYKVTELRKLTNVSPQEWSKLEGWTANMYKQWGGQVNMNATQMIFERIDNKKTEFNKLPKFKKGQKTMTYAGVGSRQAPPKIRKAMTEVAAFLESVGYTLQTGDAKGADKAFRNGVTYNNNVEVFDETDATDQTRQIAIEIHPMANRIAGNARSLNLMARNTNQIFGKELDTPVDFIIAWTQDGVTKYATRTQNTGGTGQAIAMADLKGIPVINLNNKYWRQHLRELVSKNVNLPKPKSKPKSEIKSESKSESKSETNVHKYKTHEEHRNLFVKNEDIDYEHQNRYLKYLKSKDLRTSLQAIADANVSPVYTHMIKRMIPMIRNPILVDEFKNHMSEDELYKEISEGRYEWAVQDKFDAHSKILINTNYKGSSLAVFMHEAIHAVTAGNMNIEKNSAIGTAKVKKANKDLDNIITATKQFIGTNFKIFEKYPQKVLDSIAIGLENQEEFIAQAFSSKHMQDFLRAIPYKHTTVWNQFVTTLRKLFGIKTADQNVLSATISIMDSLMEESAIYNEKHRQLHRDSLELEAKIRQLASMSAEDIETLRVKYGMSKNEVDITLLLQKYQENDNEITAIATVEVEKAQRLDEKEDIKLADEEFYRKNVSLMNITKLDRAIKKGNSSEARKRELQIWIDKYLDNKANTVRNIYRALEINNIKQLESYYADPSELHPKILEVKAAQAKKGPVSGASVVKATKANVAATAKNIAAETKKTIDSLLNRTGIKTKMVEGSEALRVAVAMGMDKAETEIGMAYGSLQGFAYKVPNSKNEYSIYINPLVKGKLREEVIRHEVGHIIMYGSNFNKNSKEAAAIMEEFEIWREARGKDVDTIYDLIKSKKTPEAALSYIQSYIGDNRTAKLKELPDNLKKYLLDFDEWFADQAAKALMRKTPTRTLVQKFFDKMVKALRKVFGKPAQSTKAVNNEVGKFIDRLRENPTGEYVKADSKYAGLSATFKTNIDKKGTFSKAMETLRNVLLDKDYNLRALGGGKIPAFQELANLMFKPRGNTEIDNSYWHNKMLNIAKYDTRALDIMRGASKELQAKVIMELHNEDRPDAFVNSRTVKLRALFRDLSVYMQKAGILVNNRKNYFPEIANQEYTESHHDEFVAMMKKYPKAMDGIAKKWNKDTDNRNAYKHRTTDPSEYITAADVPQLMYDNIVRGDVMDEARQESQQTPHVRFLKHRLVNFLQGPDLENWKKNYLQTSVTDAVTTYVMQAVKRAEYEKRFGRLTASEQTKYVKELMAKGGKKFKDYTPGDIKNFEKTAQFTSKLEILYDKAKEQGATIADIEKARDYVAAEMGTHGRKTANWLNEKLGIPMPQSHAPINTKLQTATSTMMSVANLMVLGLSTITSLLDPIGIAVRTGSFNQSMKSVYAGIKETVGKDKGELEVLAEAVGAISDAATKEALAHGYNMVNMTPTVRKMNDKFFKLIGLEQWTKMTRVMAVDAAQGFIKRHDKNPNKHSERFLKELGIQKGDIKYGKNGKVRVFTYDEYANASAADKKRDDRVKSAIAEFVDTSILRPSPSQRPAWASDPHYAILFHLKSFMYSFQKTILNPIYREAKLGNYAPLLAASMYLPAGIMVGMVKDIIKTAGDDDDDNTPTYKENWGWTDYVIDGAEKSGLTGMAQPIFDMNRSTEYGGTAIGGLISPAMDIDTVTSLPVPLNYFAN